MNMQSKTQWLQSLLNFPGVPVVVATPRGATGDRPAFKPTIDLTPYAGGCLITLKPQWLQDMENGRQVAGGGPGGNRERNVKAILPLLVVAGATRVVRCVIQLPAYFGIVSQEGRASTCSQGGMKASKTHRDPAFP